MTNEKDALTLALEGVETLLTAFSEMEGAVSVRLADLDARLSDQADDISILSARLKEALAQSSPEDDEGEEEDEEEEVIFTPPARTLKIPREGSKVHTVLVEVLTRPGPWSPARVREMLDALGKGGSVNSNATAGNVLDRLTRMGYLQRNRYGSYNVRKSVRPMVEDLRKAVTG